MPYAERIITNELARVGVEVGGSRPWDVRVHDRRFFSRVIRAGSLGAGEAYVDGWWDCDRLDELVARLLRSDVHVEFGGRFWNAMASLIATLSNRQAGGRARAVANLHYDRDVAMFEAMLGPTMNYSCAYWRHARDLDAAQRDKMELICRKLGLQRGHKLLDLGCGWGGLARYAARRFRCRVFGVTISERQSDYAREFCRGLPVDILNCDYRDPAVRSAGPFDRVVSVGMFEHVGRKNFATFFDVCRDALTDGGLVLLQTFGREGDASVDLWTDRYIFPNSYVPTISDIGASAHGRFIMEDWHNFGADYDRTLMAWHARFERWAARQSPPLDQRFHRMWRYYLLTYAGCFRARTSNQLWQIVLSKRGCPGGYASVRELAPFGAAAVDVSRWALPADERVHARNQGAGKGQACGDARTQMRADR